MSLKNNLYNIDSLLSYFIVTFVIFFISGPFFLNLFSLIFTLYFFCNFSFFNNYIYKNFNFKIICIIMLFALFPFNALDFSNSFFKYIAYFRNIFMGLGILILLKKQPDALEKYKKFFTLVIFIISIDVIFEFYFGTNITGNKSSYPGRIASFTGDELIIGYIFCFISILILGHIEQFIDRKKILRILAYSLLIFISFIIGERSNFIKFSILLVIFWYIFYRTQNLKASLFFKTIIFVTLLSIISLFFLKDTQQFRKLLYINNTPVISKNFNIKDVYFLNKHIPHYITAYKIFKNYPLFGIGINNFAIESQKKKYEDRRFQFNQFRNSTHPHQIYLELLCEVGLFGFIFFLYFFSFIIIKSFKKIFSDKKTGLIPHLILFFFFIFPIIPSGSFFGTMYTVPFWFNLAFILHYLND